MITLENVDKKCEEIKNEVYRFGIARRSNFANKEALNRASNAAYSRGPKLFGTVGKIF